MRHTHVKHACYKAHRFHFLWRHVGYEELFALAIALLVFVPSVSAATRLQDRSLYIESARPSITTSYKLSFRYMTPEPVGSVDMLFCVDPIPYMPCVPPAGLDASGAVLADQSGETGFTIQQKTANHIVLSRTPGTPVSGISSYTFDDVVNPSGTTQSFSIRLRTHSSMDTTGPQIDFGSVKSQVTNSVVIETQVPPMLIFCVAQVVEEDCINTNSVYYTDLGELNAESTLTAQSQMAVGTNASGGFAITATGTPLAAGTNVIDSPSVPTASTPGRNQFGINLVANNQPTVGSDPEGIWANAVPGDGYGIPNMYKFVPGDVIAYSPNVSLMKKFTVSYIVNSSPELRAGVYTTTMTYIASGRF